MKIAYIMLCHKNAEQINTLVNELLKNDADVYIHLDLKSNIRDEIIKNERVILLDEKECYSVSWGGNDMIKATLSLLNKVKQSNKKYDYVWLVSGQDFPIVSAEEIEKRLSENKETNYIEIIEDSKEYNRYNKLYEIWYPKWITKNNNFIKSIKRIYMILTGGFNHTFKIFKRKKPIDYNFQFGSQWWTLTYGAAMYILDYCNNNPKYLKYFEHCIIPDECFFQTLFMASPYRNKRKTNLTFVNWKGDRRSPSTLTIEDKEMLKDKSKDFCIARKFDFEIDSEIIKIIQKGK